MQTNTDRTERALRRVRAILAQRIEERITEHEAIDELIAEIEAAGFDVCGPTTGEAAPQAQPGVRH
jgi:hypothetical protein